MTKLIGEVIAVLLAGSLYCTMVQHNVLSEAYGNLTALGEGNLMSVEEKVRHG